MATTNCTVIRMLLLLLLFSSSTFLIRCFDRYADLKNNRLTNYTFDFNQMLNDKVR